ncbi:MAG TPA: kinesin, partial [Myxococcota bacterium]|nr:kinesin [Myxococcota bacterium]
LKETAQILLESQKVVDRSSITLAQVRSSEVSLQRASVNGDGILAPDTIEDATVARLLHAVLLCMPPKVNRSGKPGVDKEMLRNFKLRREQAIALLQQRSSLMFWGDRSEELAGRILALKNRLDEYFLQCRLVASQPGAAAAFQLQPAQMELLLGDAAALRRWLDALPVAPPEPTGILRWDRLLRGRNYEELLALRAGLALEDLSEPRWRELCAQATAVQQWRQAHDAESLCALPDLESFGEATFAAADAAADADLSHRDNLIALDALEKLILFQRWLLTFANSFIAMTDLYDPQKTALFEYGRLVIAGRNFRLAVRVPDHDAHVKLAENASMCLAYVRVQGKGTDYEVVVPITAGTADGINVGKRGLFYDLNGQEFDAIITHVVSQPVSLWEAMTQPFLRIGSFVRARVEEFAEQGESKFDQGLSSFWKQTTAAGKEGAATEEVAPPPADAAAPTSTAQRPAIGGMVAAGGVAFAAISSSVAFVVSQLKSVTPVELIQGGVAVVLIVMVPSGLLGWMKIRRRNLAVVLEGSGWAMNDSLILTRPLGNLFTRRPAVPKGSTVETVDWVKQALSLRQRMTQDRDVSEVREGALILVVVLLLALLGLVSYWNRVAPRIGLPVLVEELTVEPVAPGAAAPAPESAAAAPAPAAAPAAAPEPSYIFLAIVSV